MQTAIQDSKAISINQDLNFKSLDTQKQDAAQRIRRNAPEKRPSFPQKASYLKSENAADKVAMTIKARKAQSVGISFNLIRLNAPVKMKYPPSRISIPMVHAQ